MEEAVAPIAVYSRMTVYLKALRAMKKAGKKTVSSVSLAEEVRFTPSLVKKDLSFALRSEGKPKIGYELDSLIADVEAFLGYDSMNDAVLVGVGKLGQALLGYTGFGKYGFNVAAGFDVNESLIGKEYNGKTVYSMNDLKEFCQERKIKIGIITTPKDFAQEAADALIGAGIRAIWNFTPTHLALPGNVAVKNEDMAASLAILSLRLKEILKND